MQPPMASRIVALPPIASAQAPRVTRREIRGLRAQTCLHHSSAGCRGTLRDVQEAAWHSDPRTTMRYDRAGGSLDRYSIYIAAAYVAGAAW